MKKTKNGLQTRISALTLIPILGFAIAAHADVLIRKNVSEDELMNMIMRGSVKGRITSVTYVQDQGSGFLLDVSFEGYSKHSELTFAGRLEKDGRTIGNVIVADHELGDETGQIRIALSIEGNTLQESIEVDSLILTVDKGRPRQQYTYSFDKSWGPGSNSGSNSGTASTNGEASDPVALVQIRPRRLNPDPVKFQFKAPVYAFMAQTQTAKMAQATQSTQSAQAPNANSALIQGAQNNDKCFHTNGDIIHVWECDKGPDRNKKWKYEPSSGYIRSALRNNKCIHKKGDNWNNGSLIHLWDCDKGPARNKSWTYDAKAKVIKARHKPDKCIHKAKPGWANGNILHLYPCSSGPSENWTWVFPAPAPLTASDLPVLEGYEIFIPTGPEADTEAKGVGPKVDLIQDLDNAIFENRDFLGIDVYEDMNPASGAYYFNPMYYSLDWDASKGDRYKYGMEITYDTGPQGQDISMGMRLRASFSEHQRQFVRRILEDRNPNFKSLTPVEGNKSVNMSNELKNLFGIAEENIAVNEPTPNEVKVVWLTNSIAKESLVFALTSQMGLDGNVVVSTTDEVVREFPINMYGHLATSRTYGQIKWDEEKGWENKTFHPIILKYMHAIKVDNDLSVDSWDLDLKRVPAGGFVEWDASEVPSNLNSDYDYVWFEYGVEGCDQCDRKAVQAITGGTGDETKVTVSVNVMTPISSCDLAAGLIKIRSRNLRPDSGELETVDIAVSDQMSFDQVFYMSPEQSGSQLGEYQILGVQASGQMLQTNQWLPINDTVIYVGSHQLAELHGTSVSCR